MSGIYDDTVFDELPDDDLDEPEDGRYGSPEDGSSDSPETMNRIDPLRRHTYLLDDDLDDGTRDTGADDGDTELEWDADDEEGTGRQGEEAEDD